MYAKLSITSNLIDITARLLENDIRNYISDDSDLNPFNIEKIKNEIGIDTISNIFKCTSNLLRFHSKSNVNQDSNDTILLIKVLILILSWLT